MKMRLLLAAMICFVVAADDDPEQAAMQGSWTVVGFDRNGKSVGDSVRSAGLKIVFKGKNVSYVVKGKEVPDGGTVQLDPTKTPKEITTTDTKGKVEKGIYKLEGEKLTLCIAEEGKERPKEFKTTDADSGVRLFTLARDKDAKDAKGKEK